MKIEQKIFSNNGKTIAYCEMSVELMGTKTVVKLTDSTVSRLLCVQAGMTVGEVTDPSIIPVGLVVEV